MGRRAEQWRVDNETSTQVGAIGESLAAAAFIHFSKGRLSPFKPLADDGGIDLLLFDKLTRVPIPLQIKARRDHDERRDTYQFDVRRKTWSKEDSYYLFLKLRGLEIDTLWLIPSEKLEALARRTEEKLIFVACSNPTSNDRFTPYRTRSMGEAVARIFAREAQKRLP